MSNVLPDPEDFDAIRAYLQTLQVGEAVVETTASALYRVRGEVYRNKDGVLCVMWSLPGSGKMGTSVTGGARRVTDLPEGHPALEPATGTWT